jgi:hypothetical protein
MTDQAQKPTETELELEQATKLNSRKYRLAKLVIYVSTAMATLPPIVTTALGIPVLTLLTGAEWASIVGSCFLFYGAANVAELHVNNKATQAKDE